MLVNGYNIVKSTATVQVVTPGGRVRYSADRKAGAVRRAAEFARGLHPAPQDQPCETARWISEENISGDFPLSDSDKCYHCNWEIVEADYGARVWFHVREEGVIAA